jgi:hypothetical protein
MLYALLGRVVWFVLKRVVRRRAGALVRRLALVLGALAAVGALGAAGAVAARRR